MRNASTPGLKLVEFRKSPIVATVNIPDIPTISPMIRINNSNNKKRSTLAVAWSLLDVKCQIV